MQDTLPHPLLQSVMEKMRPNSSSPIERQRPMRRTRVADDGCGHACTYAKTSRKP